MTVKTDTSIPEIIYWIDWVDRNKTFTVKLSGKKVKIETDHSEISGSVSKMLDVSRSVTVLIS